MICFRVKPVQNPGSTDVFIYFNDKEIGSAVYNIAGGRLCLKWLEIYEREQAKGYGTQVINFIANMAIEKHLDLVIVAVDVELLNRFYFKWFKSWGQSRGADIERIEEVFDSSIIEDQNLKIVLKCQELGFDESTPAMMPLA